MWFFYHFNFERNYDALKSKSPCILLNKNINFNKNETESKMENPTHGLERQTLCFSSYKNRKLKVKLWWVGTRKRKKDFLYRSSCPEGNFFDICLLFKCIMYWIHFQNIHTFIYQKTLLRTLFCRFSKSVESLRCILKCL